MAATKHLHQLALNLLTLSEVLNFELVVLSAAFGVDLEYTSCPLSSLSLWVDIGLKRPGVFFQRSQQEKIFQENLSIDGWGGESRNVHPSK